MGASPARGFTTTRNSVRGDAYVAVADEGARGQLPDLPASTFALGGPELAVALVAEDVGAVEVGEGGAPVEIAAGQPARIRET